MVQVDMFADAQVDAAGASAPGNYRMLGDRGLAKNWRLRAWDNVDAIELSKLIEKEGRPATREEQEALMRYIGWGASEIANGVLPTSGTYGRGWAEIAKALQDLVTDEEMAAIKRGTQYAHYTPEFIARAMWRAVRRLGFDCGNVIEPGCGTGLFFSLMPASLAERSQLVGVEMDPVTARIARLVHPEAVIRQEDFTKVRLPAGADLCIGNPPFAQRSVRADDEVGRLGLSLHEYFIARSVRMLRDGGIGAFVVSRYFMDKRGSAARPYLAQMADLLGAIRLPNDAMAADAGTEVLVDVIFLRKRMAGEQPSLESWEDADFEAVPHPEARGFVNGYWQRHPENVLGEHFIGTDQYGPALKVRRRPEPLDLLIERAIERLPANVYRSAQNVTLDFMASHVPAGLNIGTAADHADLKEGSYFVRADDVLMQVVEGRPVEVRLRKEAGDGGMFASRAKAIRSLIPIRDAARRVLRLQQANQPWEDAQADLRDVYQAFVRQFGAINKTSISKRVDPDTGAEKEYVRRVNLAPFMDDPDVWLVSAVETYSEETRRGEPGPIFSQRVVRTETPPKINGASDALAVCLNETGRVVMARIAELLGASEAEAAEQLGDMVFEDPGALVWVTADEYLSGRVKDKLEIARKAAADDPGRYGRNVLALERVQPTDLKPSEITVHLGAPWIPEDVIRDFIAEVIGIRTRVYHTVKTATWSLDMAAFRGKVEATSTWGTDRMNAAELLECALNQIVPKVHDTVLREDGSKTRVLNPQATEAAKQKLAKVQDAFGRWIWEDAGRADQLAEIYNREFNNLVPRKFNGDHLTFPGANPAVPISKHQRRVAWRIICTGNTLIAHVVGSGKTRPVVLAIMEQKRLGLVSKPLLAVPSHTLAQWAREFLALYPFANILVADEENFSKAKRGQWMARAATGNWDAIIVSHDAFKFIPTPNAFEREMLRGEVAQIDELLTEVEEGDRMTRKRIEAIKESFQAKLEALAARKDDIVTIAEIGVDQMAVDESQQFRKLSFHTNMENVLGVDPSGSQRAWDLFVKSKYLATINAGRELIMATGTPITNTMGELYTLLRFMCENELRQRQIHYFDAWAAAFCRTKDDLELLPSGAYAVRRRFALFVNVPELIDMFRSVADVLIRDDLRGVVNLPAIKGGKRQIMACDASRAFRMYQKILGIRLQKIKERRGRPQKGDDIILTVINDGRHASIDMRFVDPEREIRRFHITDERIVNFPWHQSYENDSSNKINQMIDKVYDIWVQTSCDVFTQENGQPYAKRGGAQMIFSDLGTPSIEEKRFFSAYRWIRERLLAKGVPAEEIVFMQDYKKMSEKRRLFDAVDAGKVRILIGSSMTMGTGVNAQLRLKAEHHLDVPWLPADVEQREGRIERQGNQYGEIEIFAWALLGSMDAPMWQTLERKQRFIDMVMKGDRSVRSMEDVGAETADQYALAKAISSGDERLMRKAGLEAEIGRLRRLKSAHIDDKIAVRREIEQCKLAVTTLEGQAKNYRQDLDALQPFHDDDGFHMTVDGVEYRDWIEEIEEDGKVKKIEHNARREAGSALMKILRTMEVQGGDYARTVGSIGGFDLTAEASPVEKEGGIAKVALYIEQVVPFQVTFNGATPYHHLLGKIENRLLDIQHQLEDAEWKLSKFGEKLANYENRTFGEFEFAGELALKEAELAELDKSLEASERAANDDSEAEAAA